tara:strand:- start:2501 stop:3343 length:843 start_codon:yes stop_codon:yes gene_type:complete
VKVAKSKLRRIILEELQFILSEQDDDAPGTTRVVSRAELRRDAARKARRQAEKEFFGTDSNDPLVTSDVAPTPSPDDTQEVDMEAIIQQQIDSMANPNVQRDEARRMHKVFFGGRNEYGMKRLAGGGDALGEIIEKLVGWMFPRTFKGNEQPSPMFIKVAQEFEKEGISIISNEDHFLDRVENKVLAIAKKGFADTGAGTEEDIAAVSKTVKGQREQAAKTWATNQVIKVLNDEQRDKYGYLPPLDKATTDEIDQLVRDIPRAEPELYKQAYTFYIKKTS